MTTFNIWVHPKTNQTRIYVNNAAAQGSAKAWLEEQEADTFGDEVRIRVFGNNLTRGEADNLVNQIEADLNEAAGAKVRKWADAVAMAKK